MNKLTKIDIVRSISTRTGYTQSTAEEFYKAFSEIIFDNLAEGNTVPLLNVGKLVVEQRKEHNGVNPATREVIVIPAHGVVKFKPTQALKDAVK